MSKSILKWLRWLLVLPASICIPAITIFLPELLPHIKIDDISSANFRHALYPFVTSIISILTAYVVAPGYKFKASLAIAILWLFILLAALSIVLFKVKVAGEEQYVLDNGVATISTLVGITISLIVSWKAQSKRRSSTTKTTQFWEDPFTYQLESVQIVDDEYIILDVFHNRGEFAGSSYRNEIHFKSKSITPAWIDALNELGSWPPISIELTNKDYMMISQGEYVESIEMLGLSIYYYEEKYIPLSH